MTYASFPYGSVPYGGLGGRDMTIEERIEATLFAQAAAMALTDSPPIAWPNVSFSPAGLHLRVAHLPNRNERIFAKGAAPHFRQGFLQVTIVSPLNEGPASTTVLAGEVAQHFPADLSLYSYGIRVRVQSAPEVSSARAEDAYWEAAVLIRYEALI